MTGLAGMSLADLDQESSDHSSGQTKRARDLPEISHLRAGNHSKSNEEG